MKRRILATLLLTACSTFLAAGSEPPKPNIVILFADDLGYGDLGSYGNPYIRTPNLDQLASEGQRWTDFYVAAPVCSPSRGSLMTGRVSVRTGLYGDRWPVMHPGDSHGFPDSETTIAEMLRDAGYATGMFGKWHLGDAPQYWPSRHGFNVWWGMPYSNDMDQVGAPGTNETIRRMIRGEGDLSWFAKNIERFHDPKRKSAWWNVPLIRSTNSDGNYEDSIVERPVEQTTITRRLTESAIAFIRTNADRPFFVYLPYSMPHLPVFASDAFKGTSLRGPYGDTVEELDWSAGKIREVIEELGLQDNTLLLFSSDNGPWQKAGGDMPISIELAGTAGPLNGDKATTWEGGVRVPGIFWGPAYVKPATISEIGSTLDMLATAASLAGIENVPTNDGIDLSRVLKNGSGGGRDFLPYYSHGKLAAYRRGNYKIHLLDPDTNKALETPRLFDLHQDISEQHDIALTQPELLQQMRDAANTYAASVPIAPSIFDARYEYLKREMAP